MTIKMTILYNMEKEGIKRRQPFRYLNFYVLMGVRNFSSKLTIPVRTFFTMNLIRHPLILYLIKLRVHTQIFHKEMDNWLI